MNKLKIVCLLSLFGVLINLGACATTEKWSPASSSRDLGVVRVSYEHEKHEAPQMSDLEATKLAENRCESWGYSSAEMIPGELRDCSVEGGGTCALWKVTREYQCKGDGSYARAVAR